MDKVEHVKNSIYGNPLYSNSEGHTLNLKRGIADLSSDLVTAINSAGR